VLSKLGKYEIVGELGNGALGTVYEAFDPMNERAVAIKTVKKSLIDPVDTAGVFARFRPDAQEAVRLVHPGIVSMYEYGEEGDMIFIAMELLTGISIDKFLNKGRRLAVSEISNILSQLLDVLEYSHARGVIHSHIKPENIVMVKDGNVKITDFGLSKIQLINLANDGTAPQVSAYISPEQLQGHSADTRSDVYSTGIILYQLLTGELPFTRSTLNPEGAYITSGISKSIDEVIKKSLAQQPNERYQRIDEFRNAINQAASPDPSPTSVDTPLQKEIIEPAQLASKPEKNLIGTEENAKVYSVDMDFFEERLREAKQSQPEIAKRKPAESKPEKIALHIETLSDIVKPHSPVTPESKLLAALEQEARASLDSKNSHDKNKHAQDSILHDALERVLKFFTPFARHVNHMEPGINRTYRFGATSEFTNLKWGKALIESRKLSLSDSALLSFVTFRLKLLSPKPIIIKRPYSQLEALKKELHQLRLKTLEDLESIKKNPGQEWIEIQLDSVVPVQITFKGNYELGKINVMTRNLTDFGQSNIKLEPANITPEFLDELGRFLIGRSEKLPTILHASGNPIRPKSK